MTPSKEYGSSYCSAVGCTNSYRKCPALSFFRFPKDKTRCKRWVVNCRRADLDKLEADYLNENCRLCALHFEESEFMNPVLKNKLIWSAVPTLFPNVPNSPSQLQSKRHPPKQHYLQTTCGKSLEEEQHLDVKTEPDDCYDDEVYVKDEPDFEKSAILGLNTETEHCNGDEKDVKEEKIDIKEEVIQEVLEIEDTRNKKRSAHPPSCSKSKKNRSEVEGVRVQDEPDFDKSAMSDCNKKHHKGKYNLPFSCIESDQTAYSSVCKGPHTCSVRPVSPPVQFQFVQTKVPHTLLSPTELNMQSSVVKPLSEDMAAPLSEDELNLLSLCAVALCKRKQNKKKKHNRNQWMKNWLLKRDQFTHIDLLNELRLDPGHWFNYLRMDEATYLQILSLVTPMIEKQDSCMRRAITPHERLSATLRFLATGRSYEDMKFSVAISAQALSRIIPETCLAIWKTLQKDYMKFPDSEDEWTQIADEFHEKWNFPNCLGAVDGKHVTIIPPNGAGSYYFNYKGCHSLVLMAIVNAKYEFIMCDFGTNGCISDGGVMENTSFYERLCNNNLKIPSDRNPTNSSTLLPFVFVGNEAFTLRKDIMKPFNQEEITHDRGVFNYRLSKAHHVVENVFNIMSSRFRIFNKPINLSLKNTDIVVLGCCILHNYLRRSLGNLYASSDQLDSGDDNALKRTDSTFIDLEKEHNHRSSEQAKDVQEKFLRYFNGDGAVPWQEHVMCQD